MNRCKDGIHKYQRFQKSNKNKNHEVYYCIRCPHYTRVEFILGHKCECWVCGNSFTISSTIGLKLKPTCGCDKIKRTSKVVNDTLNELLAKIGAVK